MTGGAADDRDGIDGVPLDDAVDAVVEGGEGQDRETARERLESVVDDGVVSRDALADQTAHVAKVVSTAETRTELAEHALADAREAADHVADLGVVSAHLDRFESQLADLRDRRDRLGERLDDAVDRTNEASIYAATTELRDVDRAARDVQRAADVLQTDVDSFERWIDAPALRYEELEADLDALADSLSDLDDAVDRIADATDDAADGDGTDGDPEDDDTLARSWADATIRVRVIGLFLTDVEAELADLRTWAEREGIEDVPSNDLDDRVASLDERSGAIEDRLSDLERSAWRGRFADELSSFDDELAAFEPPVPWGEVRETLERYRAEFGAVG